MSRLHRLTFLVLALAGTPNFRCFASEHVVCVHVVDAKTGNVIPRGNLEMRWAKPNSPVPGSGRNRLATLRQKIQPDGTARFSLDDPLPLRVRIDLGKSMGYWYPCSRGDYETNDILQHGVSEQADPWPKTKFPNISDRFHPKSGEVYYFACHIPFGEHLKEWFRGLK